MNAFDLEIQREDRKRALKTDLLRVIKRHQEWETIGVKKGTTVTVTEIREVLEKLKHTWSS